MSNLILLEKIEEVVKTENGGNETIQIYFSDNKNSLEFMHAYLETMKIVKEQYVPIEKDLQIIMTMINVYEEDSDKAMLAIDLYNYGRIQGIRSERSRRMDKSKDDKLILAFQQGHKVMKENMNSKDAYIQGLKSGLQYKI